MTYKAIIKCTNCNQEKLCAVYKLVHLSSMVTARTIKTEPNRRANVLTFSHPRRHALGHCTICFGIYVCTCSLYWRG